MIQQKYTIKREKGKHLTLIERGKIEAYSNAGYSKSKIAQLIGVSRRTIQREIQRGWVEGLQNSDLSFYNAYSAQKAQIKYNNSQSKKEGNLKINKNFELINFLENSMLIGKNSPYVALENTKKKGLDVNISLKTLYNYIHKELFIKFTEKDMCYKKNRRKKSIKEKRIRRLGGKSIDQRAQIINNREEIGHFEMDTVIGKRENSSCLLVLTDRKSRFEIIRKLNSKTTKEVIRTVKDIVKEYPRLIKTITSDNGSEFMNAKAIEDLGIEYFYAHSYCSGERGSNENNNKLIRRHIAKGMDIGLKSEEEVRKIEKWMNTYPRKLFNGKSSIEIYFDELGKYFS